MTVEELLAIEDKALEKKKTLKKVFRDCTSHHKVTTKTNTFSADELNELLRLFYATVQSRG